jgi:hypothetical protein
LPLSLSPVCAAYTGEQHGKPLEGVASLPGLTRDDGASTNGKILHPRTGKTRSAPLVPADEDRRRDVAGE